MRYVVIAALSVLLASGGTGTAWAQWADPCGSPASAFLNNCRVQPSRYYLPNPSDYSPHHWPSYYDDTFRTPRYQGWWAWCFLGYWC